MAAEEDLQRSQAEIQAILNVIPDSIFRISKDGTILDLKATLEGKDSALLQNERVRKSVHEMFPSEIAQRIMHGVERAIQTGDVQFLEYKLKLNGETRDYEARILNCDLACCREDEVMVIVRDITERKRIEEELRESERRYYELILHAPDGIIFLDKLGNIISMNPTAECLSGYTANELVGKNFAKIGVFTPQSLARALEVFKLVLTGEESRPHEIDLVRKDKSLVTVEANIRLVKRNGEIKGIEVIARDITERKRAQEKLRESEGRYRGLFDSILDGVYRTDVNGIFVMINQAGAEILGHKSAEEVIGKRSVDYWADPKDREAFIAELKRRKSVSAYHIRSKRIDGKMIDLEASSRILEDEEGNFLGIEGIIREVTEKRKLQEELKKRVEQLEAFHRVVVGRELKMIELKDKIKELEHKLAQYEGRVDELGLSPSRAPLSQ